MLWRLINQGYRLFLWPWRMLLKSGPGGQEPLARFQPRDPEYGGSVTFSPHDRPRNGCLPCREGGPFFSCAHVKSCAPCGRAFFRPRNTLHPLLLLVRTRSGLGEEVTQKGVPKVREERVPPIRPRRKFDLLGLSALVDVPIVGTVRLGRENGLHPVDRQVKRAVLDPETSKRAGDDLGDRRPQSLLERDICGRAGEKCQAARFDEARVVIFTLYHRLVRAVLEVPKDTGGQSGKVALELQSQGSHK